MTIETAYQILFEGALLWLGVLLLIMLVRAIIGPRITDRLISVNMIGTMVIAVFAILTVQLREDYLADIALIYALISFVAVLIFAAVYIRRDKEAR